MIRLDVRNYCHACTDFEPLVEKPQTQAKCDGIQLCNPDTIIFCKQRRRCENLFFLLSVYKEFIEKRGENI